MEVKKKGCSDEIQGGVHISERVCLIPPVSTHQQPHVATGRHIHQRVYRTVWDVVHICFAFVVPMYLHTGLIVMNCRQVYTDVHTRFAFVVPMYLHPGLMGKTVKIVLNCNILYITY